MTISIIETKRLKDFPPSSVEIAPQRLIDTDNVVALLVNVDARQAIEPCRMSATVQRFCLWVFLSVLGALCGKCPFGFWLVQVRG